MPQQFLKQRAILPLKALILVLLLEQLLVFAFNLDAQADSTVIKAPGFRVENHQGWFGRSKNTYSDALGNSVERKHGWFGRKSTKTKLFGSQAIKSGDNVRVVGPNGQPIIQRKRTLFGGRKTEIDATSLLQNVQSITGHQSGSGSSGNSGASNSNP